MISLSTNILSGFARKRLSRPTYHNVSYAAFVTVSPQSPASTGGRLAMRGRFDCDPASHGTRRGRREYEPTQTMPCERERRRISEWLRPLHTLNREKGSLNGSGACA